MNINTTLKLSGVAVVVVVAGVIFSGCQKTTSAPEQTGTKTEETVVANKITIANSAFGPSSLTVKAGSTVTVTNTDVAGHSVTSDDGTSFDTDILSNNQTKQFTAPTKPGTYTYHCTAHPMMKATLIVE